MASAAPEKFENVTAVCKANLYFDGKVVSHTILLPGGVKKTLGLIYPGTFRFSTGVAEKMEIIAGSCRVRLDGKEQWSSYTAGTFFTVPANAAFDIVVEQGVAEYVCSYG